MDKSLAWVFTVSIFIPLKPEMRREILHGDFDSMLYSTVIRDYALKITGDEVATVARKKI